MLDVNSLSLDRKPSLVELRSSNTFITTVVSFSVFVDQFVFAVIVPVVPFSLSERAGIPQDSVQGWVAVLLAAYGAATLLISPPWGWWIDRNTSRQFPYLVGLIIQLLSTVLLWLGRTIALQVVGRVLQGLAAAIVYITGLAILVDAVGAQHIGTYMGYVTIAINAGTFVGPLLGGIVFSEMGYDAVFIMTLSLIAIDIALRLFMIEKSTAEKWLPKSGEEEALLQADRTRDSIRAQGETAKCSINGTPQTSPSIFVLLKSPRMIVALLGIGVQATIFSGFEGVLPIYVSKIFGWTSLGSGLIFLPLSIMAFFGPFIGRIVDHAGPRWPMTLGFLGLCPALVLLRFVVDDTLVQKTILCVLLAIIGFGITLTIDPLLAEICYIVEDQAGEGEQVGTGLYGQAYALFNMAWSVGCIVGPIWGNAVEESAGWGTMGWSLGVLSAVTAVPVVLWSGR